MQLEFSQQIFEKSSNIKFIKNPFSGSSRDVPCGRTDRQTDMTKLRVTFCNFAKAPKNWAGIWLVFTTALLRNWALWLNEGHRMQVGSSGVPRNFVRGVGGFNKFS